MPSGAKTVAFVAKNESGKEKLLQYHKEILISLP
jgi:hypothetical protein